MITLKSLKGFSPEPIFFLRFHRTMTMIWFCLLVPSLLWWKTSLLWVIMMSVWANFAAHFASWQATRAELREKNRQEQI